MLDEKSVNARLKRLYGNDPYLNVPYYRVVRAENQTVARHGTFNDFYGAIFIRRVTEVREVKKYDYLPPCWILERVEPNLSGDILDVSKPYTYECITPFLDANNNALPLNWRAIELAISLWHRRQAAKTRGLTDAEWKAQEEKELEQEALKSRNELEEDAPLKELPTFTSSVLVGSKHHKRKIDKDIIL